MDKFFVTLYEPEGRRIVEVPFKTKYAAERAYKNALEAHPTRIYTELELTDREGKVLETTRGS